MPDKTLTTISKAILTSPEFLTVFNLELYKMRKHGRYQAWSYDRRQQAALGKSFDALVSGNLPHSALIESTMKTLAMRMT